MLARMWRKSNNPRLLVVLQAGTTTLKISLAIPQKIEAHWTRKLYMPQYRGTPGPKSGNGWVGKWGEGMGDFWNSIGNVNEENT